MCFDATQLSVATLTMAFTTDDPRVQCVFNIYLFEYSTYKDIHQVHRHSRACNQIVSAFYGQEAFLTQRFRYNGNSHIRLIRPIMLLSRQQVITRQGKSTKEVQQFFLFNAKMVFIFVTICIQICLNYNCFQEIFGEKYFPQFKWRLHESSVWLSASGVGRVELMSLIKSVDFHHFCVSFFFFFDYCTGSPSWLSLVAPLLYSYSPLTSPVGSNK